MKKNIVFLICLLLTGCGATNYYYYSKPVFENNIGEFKSNGITILNLKDIKIYLYPVNHIHSTSKSYFEDSTGSSYSKDYFDIQIYIVSNKDQVEFNPNMILLKMNDGSYFSPEYIVRYPGKTYWVSAKGPHKLLTSGPNNPLWEVNREIITQNEYIQLTKDGNIWADGYVLRFNVKTPAPGIPFDIGIEGLKHNNKLISVPHVSYKEKSKFKWTYN